MHIHLLLVEDNLDLAITVIEYLEISGIGCDHASNGQAGLSLALKQHYDVILLDIMLPRLDGQQVCEQLRQQGSQTPILMLTSLDALSDKLASFAAGADDYLVKPFELAELVARIRALSMRRSGQASRLQVDDLVMELTTRKVSRAGQELHLSPICWTLLECLMRASPEPVTRERLETTIWGDEPPDSNNLKVHMHRLRKTVDKPFGQPLIHTLPGVGIQLTSHA
ncbi:response regulator transcription factor [Pseudomonas sp. ADAK18]|uniref:response regulator transcription factor n=1 Tax=Pseudomonas sp. ADAK18 TaxID=2730848 RepID=UPI0014639F09|nr:response regulator transcription factor [Pseudomonas sp. ADAK18]QJI28950.1 response regulator transcription factor [Pseudomonas sp. ADAK18]